MRSQKGTVEDTVSERQQMAELRELVLGKNNSVVKGTIEDNAREVVSTVLSEALHDRQKSDGSVTKVLAPLVEKSVEASVVARKEQFVSYLYPLVGSLVRKSVSAFLSEVIEQTNELLESSLTYKGLKWRFKAWQAGVSYSQYVVSQTFVYRVEQVLLIHRETGVLLKTVVRDKTQATDGDMVSAMLTAINDFVSDSFSHPEARNEQNLDEIKTDDFTLLIKQGPRAVLVAAITGKAPANIGEQLQLTLEDIHRLYGEELEVFEGDDSAFENTEQQLSDCMLAKQKETEKQNRKFPWLAILLSLVLLSSLGYFFYQNWVLDYRAWQIKQEPLAPGIVLLNAERCDDKVCVDVLRDPVAPSPYEWLNNVSILPENLSFTERSYRSMEPELLEQRLEQIAEYFTNIKYLASESVFSGETSPERYRELRAKLLGLPEDLDPEQLLKGVTVTQLEVDQSLVQKILLDKNIAQIEQTSIYFNTDESELTDTSKQSLKALSLKINEVAEQAQMLSQTIQIVVMGASDSIGASSYNLQLSKKRSEAVRNELINMGVDPTLIRSIGLGVLNINNNERRVIFGVIRLAPGEAEKVQE